MSTVIQPQHNIRRFLRVRTYQLGSTEMALVTTEIGHSLPLQNMQLQQLEQTFEEPANSFRARANRQGTAAPRLQTPRRR